MALKQSTALAAATLIVIAGVAGCDKTTPTTGQSPTPTPMMSEDTMTPDDTMESPDSMTPDDSMTHDNETP